MEQLAIRLSPQAGKSLVIPRRRESSKINTPRSGQKSNVGSLCKNLLINWIPAYARMTCRNVNGLFCTAIIACCFTHPASAQELSSDPSTKLEDTFLLRPHAGIGVINDVEYRHEGFRLLINASDTKRYGFEYSRVSTAQGDYIASGIVLEKKEGALNLSIGTIGYNGQNGSTQFRPGVVLNVGWEPPASGSFRPFISYRNDVIFADTRLFGHALSMGLAASF